MFLGLHYWRCEVVYCWYCELLLESSVVAVELALKVYCNLVLKIIHCAGSGGVGLFYRKAFPHRQIFLLCVSVSICFMLAEILLLALYRICKCKFLIGFASYFP